MADETEPKLYEVSYLLQPELDAEKAAEKSALFRDAAEKEQVITAEEGRPEMKKLAYPIKDKNEAYLGWLKFFARPQAMAKLQDMLKSDKDIIRVRIFRTKKAQSVERPRIRKQKPAVPKVETNIEEIDKKLEELLGK